MAMSDRIEAFIVELMKEDDSNGLEIGRNELAGIFNCVPSQINYVISTRFSPEKGYIVESRRGGGGYIKIKRIPKDMLGDMEQIIKNIEGGVSEKKAKDIIEYLLQTGRIEKKQKKIIEAAVCDGVLTNEENDIRARILKNILMKLTA